MKRLILSAVILFSLTINAQNPQDLNEPGRFMYGILGGFSTSKMHYINLSLLAEGRYNLTENLGIKISLSHSAIRKGEGYNVKTFNHIQSDNVNEYKTVSYIVEKCDYSIVPVSIGLEFKIKFEKIFPYCGMEFGVNSYKLSLTKGSMVYGAAGTFSSYNELPDEYKAVDSATYRGMSYRIGFEMGLRYSLASSINLDIRYLYQVNTSLVNNHTLLFGITI